MNSIIDTYCGDVYLVGDANLDQIKLHLYHYHKKHHLFLLIQYYISLDAPPHTHLKISQISTMDDFQVISKYDLIGRVSDDFKTVFLVKNDHV